MNLSAALAVAVLMACGGESAKEEATITEEQAVELAAETIAIQESLEKAAQIDELIEKELRLLEEEAAKTTTENTK